MQSFNEDRRVVFTNDTGATEYTYEKKNFDSNFTTYTNINQVLKIALDIKKTQILTSIESKKGE